MRSQQLKLDGFSWKLIVLCSLLIIAGFSLVQTVLSRQGLRADCASNIAQLDPRTHPWQLNSSNPTKVSEFERLFSRHGMRLKAISRLDLREIDSDDVQVVVHKASQLSEDGILVEDSSLEVEGAEIGVHLKWFVHRLGDYVGRRARLTVLIAYRMGDFVYVHRGQLEGLLVAPQGTPPPGSPLNAYFRPDGSAKTLAQELPEHLDPRALAFKAVLSKDYVACVPPMLHWTGAWQDSSEAD